MNQHKCLVQSCQNKALEYHHNGEQVFYMCEVHYIGLRANGFLEQVIKKHLVHNHKWEFAYVNLNIDRTEVHIIKKCFGCGELKERVIYENED